MMETEGGQRNGLGKETTARLPMRAIKMVVREVPVMCRRQNTSIGLGLTHVLRNS